MILNAQYVFKISMLGFFIFLTSCAAVGVRDVTQNKQLPRVYELSNTPFFPQELYQCGPAALATVLNAIAIPVTPEQLTPEVYIPSRKGSLQIEMLAAARRHGALAVQIPPKLESILQEIAAGNPVLVMQNLGFSWAPSWHYAVVVGYDLDKEKLWLRSGTFKRFEMTLSTFQRTWARSEQWAFVAIKPGDLSASANSNEMIKALIQFEKNATIAENKKAYQASVNRWPDNLVLLMGLGNSAFKANDYATAENAFNQAINTHPKAAAAYNNLANVLLAQGRAVEAKAIAQKGLKLAENDEKLKAQINQTISEINASK